MSDSYLDCAGIICSLGNHKSQVANGLFNISNAFPERSDNDSSADVAPLFRVHAELPEIPSTCSRYRTRTNQLLLAALQQIRAEIDQAISSFGRSRIAVMIGTSTSGIAEGEVAISYHRQHDILPASFVYKQQEIAATAEFIARLLGLKGPAYAISTSCSSSSAAICSARRLLRHGLCDAVIVGGADALCETTIQGFRSLGAISKQACNPFSRNRDGIAIGEGAALFLMTRNSIISHLSTPIQLLGAGISSDAYHISAPDPAGNGARQAMQQALNAAGIDAAEIDYINLHGTGTPQNDSMESGAVHALFGSQTACSSTKPLTGHCLGASGAIELALCWLLLSDFNRNKRLPIHLWDQQTDPQLPKLNLVCQNQQSSNPPAIVMSNTYSFGGNNVSLILGAKQ